MNKRVNLYFFGDIGVYNEYSPSYVCSKKFAPEILYLIAENPQHISGEGRYLKSVKINLYNKK